MQQYLALFLFTTVLLTKNGVQSGDAMASVPLNDYTFHKVLRKFPAVLVKFDVAFPYGKEHETFKQLGYDTNKQVDLLLAEVGVKDYGEMENQNLAKTYNVTKDNFPAIKLFLHNKDPVSYPKDKKVTLNNLKAFLKEHTNIYIGYPGCLEFYDKLAAKYLASSNDEKLQLLKEGEMKVKTLEEGDQKSAKVYNLVMSKIIEKGNEHVTKEINRIRKILKGKLTPNKKTDLQERLNIVKSFAVAKKQEEEEPEVESDDDSESNKLEL